MGAIIVFTLLVISLWLWIRSKRKLKNQGVQGDAAFSDLSGTKTTDVISEPVQRSNTLNISGKPDRVEIVGDGRARVIEVKSGSAPKNGPYDNHQVQLAAYAMLLEEEKGLEIPIGVVKYSNKKYTVPITPGLRNLVRKNIREIHRIKYGGERPRRNHNSRGKCNSCEYKRVCPDPTT